MHNVIWPKLFRPRDKLTIDDIPPMPDAWREPLEENEDRGVEVTKEKPPGHGLGGIRGGGAAPIHIVERLHQAQFLLRHFGSGVQHAKGPARHCTAASLRSRALRTAREAGLGGDASSLRGGGDEADVHTVSEEGEDAPLQKVSLMMAERRAVAELLTAAKDGQAQATLALVVVQAARRNVTAGEVVREFRDGKGRTALHLAAAEGHVAVMGVLVEVAAVAS